jgi:uncharacterized membrane protein YbhN (UPF0104 family)
VPVGDGAVRRRASDVVRVVVAIVLFLALVAAIRADLTAEQHLVDAVIPLPAGLSWVVAAIWQLGTVGLIAALALLALLSRRWRMVLEMVLALAVSWALCGLAGGVLGTHGGRPADANLHGVDAGFPLARLAIAVAMAVVVLPYLNRALRCAAWALLWGAAVAAFLHGSGLPVDIAASLLLGWGVAAAVDLVFGTPAGQPTPADVAEVVGDLGTSITDIALDPVQQWGAVRYTGRDEQGGPIDVALYGRDASDAQAVGRAWRFVWYRDAGPRLSTSRLQQVEHEAYLTLLASRAGVTTSDVVVAGESPATSDAVLVTRPPAGRHLGSLGDAGCDDRTLDSLFDALRRLGDAGLSHGALSPDTIVVADDGTVALKDFRFGSSAAPAEREARDLADALVSAASVAGVDRTVKAALEALGPERLEAALPNLQPAALDRRTREAVHGRKTLLDELRTAGATAAGVEEPKLVEVHRVSLGSLAMGLGAVVGVYLIVQQFSGVNDLWATLQSAAWSWVFVAFVLAQLTNVAQAVSVIGSVSSPLPFGPTIALELANAFTGLVAGTVGTTATIIRYFQRRGLAVSVAVSSGVLVSLANMVTQASLFILCFLLTRSDFSFSSTQSSSSSGSSSGSDTWVLWLIAIGLAVVGLVTVVPAFRRRVVDKLKPQVEAARDNLRDLAGEPAKLVRLFGGAVGAQLLFAMVLGASLHAYGASASLGELIVINTIASLLGGIAPVPGGMGVIEGGLIAGFTAIGIPDTIAVAATLTARLMTCYLPPIWGYPTLVWMRRRQYL